MKIISNVRVGKPDTTPDLPSHTRGVRQGNAPSAHSREAGLVPTGHEARGTAQRSTGINPEDRNPIDPSSPNLSPA